MGWENRSGQMYYYRKKRIGKQIVSEYIGSGVLAEAIALIDTEKRKNAKWKLQEWKQLKTEVKEIDQNLDLAGNWIRALIRANMLLTGYHPHKGQWRKNRNE